MPGLLKRDGRVKLFYLGSFENYHELWPQFLRNSYPQPEMLGDFSRLTNPSGDPITIYNPFTTRFVNGDPVAIRSPATGFRTA